LFGRNKRDGDAENPVAPKHFAGGAACGSGVAVASNAVDFALGMSTISNSTLHSVHVMLSIFFLNLQIPN
jgi:hypothetical protein